MKWGGGEEEEVEKGSKERKPAQVYLYIPDRPRLGLGSGWSAGVEEKAGCSR